mmetsp:Transcript_19952/g.17630  ORF Transcript_19952/g.17630 Transcript_19952/m.17630 type:complete len:84 (-) Transcript_19952:159-410(-)
MVIQTSAQEMAILNPAQESDEQRFMDAAIQESMKENPNPDLMSYEELQELEDRIGSVSKGYTEEQLSKIKRQANFEPDEDCAI